MQPTIHSLDQLTLLGLSFYGDPFAVSGDWDVENEIGRLWQRLGHSLKRYPRLQPLANRTYEVHIYNPETEQKGHFEVFAGFLINDLDLAAPDLLVKVLPPAQYACYTVQGEKIVTDWYAEIESGLGELGYRRAGQYFFQVYDERFKGMEHLAESELDVYIPIIPLA